MATVSAESPSNSPVLEDGLRTTIECFVDRLGFDAIVSPKMMAKIKQKLEIFMALSTIVYQI